MSLRIARNCLLLGLPAIGICVACVWFAVVRVPKLENVEKARIGRQFREVAKDLLVEPGKATWRGERPKGWRQAGKRISCGDGRKAAWGTLSIRGQGRLVWVENADGTLSGVIEPEPENLFAWVWQIVAGIVVITIGMTTFGIWSFVRFERNRRDFMAATVHDLATPIAGLKMSIGVDDAEAGRLADRLSRIVANLRDFANSRGHRGRMRREAFDLRKACEEAYSLFREDFRELFDGEDIQIAGEGELMAVGDEMCTVQIMWNLFGNELKYAAPYGRVSVRLASIGGYAVVEFRDEGPGMSAWARHRAFDRYYRARTAMRSGKGGFGIGLCAARDFARAMGGELRLGKNSPHGCVFTLMLPIVI